MKQPDAMRNTLMLMMDATEQGTALRQDVLKMDGEMVKGHFQDRGLCLRHSLPRWVGQQIGH